MQDPIGEEFGRYGDTVPQSSVFSMSGSTEPKVNEPMTQGQSNRDGAPIKTETEVRATPRAILLNITSCFELVYHYVYLKCEWCMLINSEVGCWSMEPIFCLTLTISPDILIQNYIHIAYTIMHPG